VEVGANVAIDPPADCNAVLEVDEDDVTDSLVVGGGAIAPITSTAIQATPTPDVMKIFVRVGH
jgi:hypothetical protein